MDLMTGDVQFLNTCVAATPAAAATHGTAVDAVQPATPQTPTASALETLPPMGMGALCFDNSTRSAINYIICRAAEADGRTVSKIVAATLRVKDVATCRRRIANASWSCRTTTPTFRLIVQDWYEGAPTVVTTNICLPLRIDTNTTAGVVWILFPETATFTPIEVPVADGRIQLAALPSSWPDACRGTSCSRSEMARDLALTFPG